MVERYYQKSLHVKMLIRLYKAFLQMFVKKALRYESFWTEKYLKALQSGFKHV